MSLPQMSSFLPGVRELNGPCCDRVLAVGAFGVGVDERFAIKGMRSPVVRIARKVGGEPNTPRAIFSDLCVGGVLLPEPSTVDLVGRNVAAGDTPARAVDLYGLYEDGSERIYTHEESMREP